MKKAVFVILFALLSVCVFAQSGLIKELSGTVELKQAGASGYVAATTGAQVSADTIISTGFKSSALLEVGSAVIMVRPLTRLTLTEIAAQAGTETLNMNLQTGRVRVDLNPPAGAKASLSVTSPSATASVRGTSFEFNTMTVSVREGTVAFRGKAGYTVQVKAGSSSGLAAYGSAAVASSPSPVPPSPVGFNPVTSGSVGSSGTASTPGEPSPNKPPPNNNTGGNNNSGGSYGGGGGYSGGNTGGNNNGGFGVDIEF